MVILSFAMLRIFLKCASFKIHIHSFHLVISTINEHDMLITICIMSISDVCAQPQSSLTHNNWSRNVECSAAFLTHFGHYYLFQSCRSLMVLTTTLKTISMKRLILICLYHFIRLPSSFRSYTTHLIAFNV